MGAKALSRVPNLDPLYRRRVAYHEAGHAVVTYWLLLPLGDMTIQPSEELDGSFGMGAAHDEIIRQLQSGAKNEAVVSKLVQISLAGFVAEQFLAWDDCWEVIDGDLRPIMKLVDTCYPDEVRKAAFLKKQLPLTLRILARKQCWEGVKRLASELLTAITVSAERGEEILNSRIGPSRHGRIIVHPDQSDRFSYVPHRRGRISGRHRRPFRHKGALRKQLTDVQNVRNSV